MKMAAILRSFLKVGAIGFGGGSAMIPVIEKEIVQTQGLIAPELYEEHVVVANLTPGALPPKLSAATGQETAGARGALLCAAAVSAPGALGVMILLSVLSVLPSGALFGLELAAVGILSFILLIQAKYISSVQKTAKRGGYSGIAMAMMLATCLLTAGKEFRALVVLLVPALGGVVAAEPWFDLSAIEVLLLAFFLICGTGSGAGLARKIGTAMVGVVYVALASTAAWVKIPYAMPVVGAVMLGIVAYAVAKDVRNAKGGGGEQVQAVAMRPIAVQAALFAAIPLGLCAVCVLLGYAGTGFFGSAALSTVTSFGGGEAYIAVADSVFVGGGFVTREALYTQLMPISNALPGPNLVKMLTGVGYLIGFENGGMAAGLLTSVANMSVGIGSTCVVFVVVYAVYRCFSGLTVFLRLRRFVLPVVCGLLLTTMVAMVESVLQTCDSIRVLPVMGIVLMVLLMTLSRMMEKRLPDAVCVVLLGGVALLILWMAMSVG